MNPTRFDRVTKALSTSGTRRGGLRLLAGSALATLAVGLGLKETEANHFGCLHWKESCTSGGECCSGICKRKTCRAHHRGGCKLAHNFCAGGKDKRCKPSCVCNITTGNAPHCGAAAFCPTTECQRDADCGEPGAACIPPVVCQGCGSPATQNFCQRPCSS
jgi:hypothetical protein